MVDQADSLKLENLVHMQYIIRNKVAGFSAQGGDS